VCDDVSNECAPKVESHVTHQPVLLRDIEYRSRDPERNGGRASNRDRPYWGAPLRASSMIAISIIVDTGSFDLDLAAGRPLHSQWKSSVGMMAIPRLRLRYALAPLG
jgi:hypothetical protein